MSAFFVSRQTIHDTVTAWCWAIQQPRSQQMLDSIGRSLWGMNAAAMEARYGDKTGSGNREVMAEFDDYRRDAAAYVYRKPQHLSHAQAAKSAACLHYQCSEGDIPETWHTHKLLTEIVNALGEPAGYDGATWDRATDTPPQEQPRWRQA